MAECDLLAGGGTEGRRYTRKIREALGWGLGPRWPYPSRHQHSGKVDLPSLPPWLPALRNGISFMGSRSIFRVKVWGTGKFQSCKNVADGA